MRILKTFQLKFSGFKTIAICLILLNSLSLASIFSSLHQAGKFTGEDILLKQMIWIAFSWFMLIIFSFINFRVYFNSAYMIYAINIILLVIVLFFGKKVMGAQRWISIFGFTFQPSELSKAAIIIILARYFSLNSKSFIKGFLIPFSLVVLNALVIIKQPDLGTALILFFVFFIMGFFSKVNKLYFILTLSLGLLTSPFIINSLKYYQKQRLMVFINPNADPLGAGYTIIQSKIAIGSGGVIGHGYLAGTQNQFNFLPERHTDFIFTIIAEEWGFLGVILLLMIYWFILKKIIQQLLNCRDLFAFYLIVGISVLYFLHVFINIGMTLGILPVVGLPLIFLSYGGTNLLINYILMGIFLNICQNQR
ncbi:MAG: rod shape-determining protein RodA [Candidatus Omnitrophica bacterium]|nr:rod shape-determining protein RodA [Candidatus Omnitrophota bacterium]